MAGSRVTKKGQVALDHVQGSGSRPGRWGAVVWGSSSEEIIFHRSGPTGRRIRWLQTEIECSKVVQFIMIGVLFYFTARDEN